MLEMGKNTGKVREICQSENVGTMVPFGLVTGCVDPVVLVAAYRWSENWVV